MEIIREELKEKEEKALLTFLIQTREGKYVKIDESLLSCTRIKEQREEPYDVYYYSVR
ncbi:MAG: hypothetical protein ACUZ77_09975 [Candidatus Brocadiales bacterium]